MARSLLPPSAAAILLVVGCSSSVPAPPPSRATGETSSSASARPAAGRPAGTALQCAPPGLVTPASGRVREILPGTRSSAFSWRAVLEIAPDDPIVARTKAEPDDEGFPETWDAGDVGLVLYLRQVRALGIETTTYGPLQFAYTLPSGDQVMAYSHDQHHGGDPTGFTIAVGPAGG